MEEKREKEIEKNDEGDIIEVENEEKMQKLMEVRISNFAFNQKKISEFVSCFFAILGVGSSIVASEINCFYNLDDINKSHIHTMIIISNIASGGLSILNAIY